ncbi:LysR family transcriptional regulator [Thiotrichales bacterium 19S11-10]|nr:LysR family transcriptional regulator [Thiotrichales bacterium 19S11-10]
MSLLGNQLEAFIAVAKYQSVHKAADSLFLTQTAITQRLRSLEAKLAVSLFIRSRKGMLLTEEGKTLLRYCQATQMLEKDCLDQIHGTSLTSVIRLSITAPSSVMSCRIMETTYPILKQFPNLRINFETNDDANSRQKLLMSGDVDLAILDEQHLTREMQKKSLISENYLLVASKKLKDLSLKKLIQTKPIIDFNESDQATFDYLKAFDLFDLCQKERYFANNNENLLALLKAGIGYTVITEDMLKQQSLSFLHVFNRKKAYQQNISLCWYLRPNMPEYFKTLIEVIN